LEGKALGKIPNQSASPKKNQYSEKTDNITEKANQEISRLAN